MRPARARSGARRRRATGWLVVLATAALSGCGVGAGEEAGGVHLRVTDDFGAKVLLEPDTPKQSGSDTVMRLLQRNADVKTRYSGGFVQSINGVAGASAAEQIDWFYYVNGLLAERGAAAWRVRDGERIWWDRHRWDTAQIGAVVGDFPQPMKDGSDGKFAGAQLDCRAAAQTCALAKERLETAGVRVTVGDAAGAGGRTRVIVGAWPKIRSEADEVPLLRRGPVQSGVFAKLATDGGIIPLDRGGRPIARIDNLGDGLVAALRAGDASPVWVVTGRETDGGLQQAVRALDATVLSGRTAVLVTGDAVVALPLRPGEDARKLSR